MKKHKGFVTIKPSMSTTNANRLQSDARGMVSFLVTFIMLLVISLIVVGFTRVSSQNRRDALDRQLGTQAFYAAESGVNALIKQAETDPTVLTSSYNSCNNPPISFPSLSDSPDVKITCVLVDPLVPNLEIGSLSAGKSQVFTIDPRAADGSPAKLKTLLLVWGGPDSIDINNSISGCTNSAAQYKAKYLANCEMGMVRGDLYKEGGAMNADALAANTRSFFMQPNMSNQSVSLDYGSATRAYRGLGRCLGTLSGWNGVQIPQNQCMAAVTIANPAAAGTKYHLRVSTLYNDASSVKVYAFSETDSKLNFAGAQAIVDSTGKAVDVFRRVQVRVPLDQSSGEGVMPFAAYSKEGVCKRFTITGTLYEDACNPPTTNDSDASYATCGSRCDPSGGGSGGGGSTLLYWYRVTFQVTSVNNLSQIDSCVWNFGDGTGVNKDGIQKINDPAECMAGRTIQHDFPKRDGKCYQVTVRFTVNLNGGGQRSSEPRTYWIPFSPSNKPWCPGH